MLIRTVSDFRSNKPKYLIHTALLAASWHRYARNCAPLEIFSIGKMPASLKSFLSSINVVVRDSSAGPNDSFSKTSNTIQGAEAKFGHQILLIDNDVVFTGPIEPLLDLPKDKIYGAVSGNNRVSPSRWRIIQDDLGMKLLQAETMPINESFRVLIDQNHGAQKLIYVYVNGGVLLFPPEFDFKSTWESHQSTIRYHFINHPLKHHCVCTSNMAALATTIGAYGKFDWLPNAYNYRHKCFGLGLCKIDDIRMIHMTGGIKGSGVYSTSAWINTYWRKKMTAGFGDLKRAIKKSQFTERLSIAMNIRDNVLETVKSYGLDEL